MFQANQRNLTGKTSQTRKPTKKAKFYGHKDVQKSVEKAKKELKEILENLIEGKSTFTYEGKICTATPLDFHRCILEWSRGPGLDQSIRNIITSSFFSCEVLAGGSSLLACAMWLDSFSKISSNRRCSQEEILEVISSYGRSGLSKEISTKIFKMGSCGSEVKLTEGQQEGTKIEVIEGKEIFGQIDNLFISKHPGKKIDGDFYLVAIDGVIENISQVHSLLESFGEEKAIIAARGFFPDVSNTFAANYSLQKLSVIPFVVSDWNSENFLDLEKLGISCASTEVGSDLSMLRAKEKIRAHVGPKNLIFKSEDQNFMRKITVSFGRDLGSLRGISLDRTKILLALTRFSSRKGTSRCKIFGREFHVPNITIIGASKAFKSLEDNLQKLGGVISISE